MLRRICLGVAVMALGGCSYLSPSTQLLTVSTAEPDAEILIDGAVMGYGRVEVPVCRNMNHWVEARKDTRSKRRLIRTVPSLLGILDFIGAWAAVYPALGLLAPGSRSLQVDEVTLELPALSDP